MDWMATIVNASLISIRSRSGYRPPGLGWGLPDGRWTAGSAASCPARRRCRACRSRRADAPRPVRLPLRTSPRRRRRHRRSSGTGRAGERLSVLCPKGVPVPALPWTKWSDVGPLLVGAVGIILVSLTDTIATATNFASRRGDEVDPDQERVGIGTSNVAADSSRSLPSPSAVAAQPWLTSLEPGPNWLAWSVQAWSLSCSSFSTGSWPIFLRPPWPLSSSLRLCRSWTWVSSGDTPRSAPQRSP